VIEPGVTKSDATLVVDSHRVTLACSTVGVDVDDWRLHHAIRVDVPAHDINHDSREKDLTYLVTRARIERASYPIIDELYQFGPLEESETDQGDDVLR